MCAGFNLQLSTLNPVSPCIHSARWSMEIFMRLGPARHFFPSVFRLLPRCHTFCPYLGVMSSDRPHNQPQMTVKRDRGFFAPPGFVMLIRCPVEVWIDENTSLHVDMAEHPFTYLTCGEAIAEVGHLELIFTSCPSSSFLRKKSWSRAKTNSMGVPRPT